MRRRAFLASAGIAALAGCSNGDGSSSTATSTPTPTGSGSPDFELLGVEAPDTRALNVPTTFAIGVENTGSGKGTFTSALETKVGDDGEWETAGEVEMGLAAGERGEWRSPRFVPQYLTTLHYRLVAFDETWSIEITPKRLDFSHYYTTPNGLYINVLGGSFEREFPTPSNDTEEGTTTPEPTTAPDGETWAIMRVEVRNRLEEPQTIPAASTFVMEVDGERRSQHQEVSDDPYEGRELDARTITRGDLVYAVPEGTRARDVTVWWEQSLPNGDVKAIWTK
jgi:hypothetical protein